MTPDRDEYAQQEAQLDELYREVILDHYRNPRHRGSLPAPTVSREGYNPLCGDEITLELAVDGEVIRDVAVSGGGCSISQSSASMMAEAIVGKRLEDVEALFENFTAMMQGSAQVDPESLGDLEALSGVRRFPVRVKCATLAWHTLREALEVLAEGRG
jgi:nitrogen fixation NifU-like protein